MRLLLVSIVLISASAARAALAPSIETPVRMTAAAFRAAVDELKAEQRSGVWPDLEQYHYLGLAAPAGRCVYLADLQAHPAAAMRIRYMQARSNYELSMERMRELQAVLDALRLAARTGAPVSGDDIAAAERRLGMRKDSVDIGARHALAFRELYAEAGGDPARLYLDDAELARERGYAVVRCPGPPPPPGAP